MKFLIQNTKLATILLIIGISTWGCQKVEIIGRVIDSYGNPIQEAIVTIHNSRSQTSTNEKGEYIIPSYPGNIKLIATKRGYVSNAINLEIKDKGVYRTDEIILYKIPEEEGLFFINTPQYQKLLPSEITIHREGSGAERVRKYCISPEATPFIIREKGLRFFDYRAGPLKLFKLDEEGCAYIIRGYANKTFESIEDHKTTLEKYKIIREVVLKPGDYLYADWEKNWFDREGYYIRVLPYPEK